MNRSIFRMGLFLGFALLTAPLSAQDFGAAGALARDTMSVEEMLVYALQDEYLARAEYELILEEWGIQRPFANIIRSEERHIAALLPLFNRYGVAVPEDTAAEHVIMPASRREAFEIGIHAEKENIAMYAAFLEANELPRDVENVFRALLRGSENHLRAFEQGLATETGDSDEMPGPVRRRPTRRR